MLNYETWLQDFVSGKTEVPALELSDKFSLHSIRRFLEGKTTVWEVAITYTGRVVVRSGIIAADGIDIEWSKWETRHDVEIPKQT